MNGLARLQSRSSSFFGLLFVVFIVGVTSISAMQERAFGQGDELTRNRNVTKNNDDVNVAAPSRTIDEIAAAERRALQYRSSSFIGWMIHASGIFGFLILIVGLVLVGLIASISLQLRRDNFIPTLFIEQFEQRISARDYQGAYEVAKGSDSFTGRVLAMGMGRLARGFDEAEAGMQEIADDETLNIEQKIGYLSLIGVIGPMLGLLGTVQGMIWSFQIIATATTTPKPSQLADGIATALFTTLEGLVVAIPAMAFYMIFKNRLARFLMESTFIVNNLMRDFQNAGKLAPKPFNPAPPQVTTQAAS